MAETIEQMFDAWKREAQGAERVERALALCDALERQGRALSTEMTSALRKAHTLEGEVLLRLGEVFLALERFDDAYPYILEAGRLSPREPSVYRLLGECLLRQGDAMRAARVFERAVELGARDPAREWLARANAFVPLQKSVGPRAVRAEVARRWFEGGLRTPVMRRVLPVEVVLTPGTVAELAEAAVRPPHVDRRDMEDSLVAPHVPGSVYAEDAPTLARREVPRDPSEGADFDPPTLLLPKAEADVESFLVSTQHEFQAPSPGGPFDVLRSAGLIDREPLEVHVSWVERRARRRAATIMLLLGMAATAFGGAAVVRRVVVVRADSVLAAKDLVEQAETLAKRGDGQSLEKARALTEKATDRAPEEPRGWLARARVEAYDLAHKETSGILATLVTRARDLGATEGELAFAEVANRIASADLTRALELVTEGDATHGNDPSFQWTAGLALMRAGDRRAIERFARASDIDPDFGHAEVMRVLLTALMGNHEAAFELARAFRVRYPDRLEGPLLAALSFLQRPQGTPPPEVEVAKTAPPTGLLGVVPLALITAAPGTRAEEEQSRSLDAWIRSATAPPLVAMGLRLARERGLHAAVASVCQSGRGPALVSGRALCASSLVMLGRHREARELLGEGDGGTDAAIVRALLAYERLDAPELGPEVGRLGEGGKKEPTFDAVRASLDVLRFKQDYRRPRAIELAERGRLWGDLVAIDSALDAGDVETASTLLRAQNELQPAHLVRASRLARIRGDLAEATTVLRRLDSLEPLPRVAYERMMLAIAKNELRDLPCSAVPCVKSKVDPVLGPAFAQAERCMLAYALPETKVGELNKGVADEGAAFVVRLSCALALAKTHSPRARDYAKSVLAGANGDVAKLGELLKGEPAATPKKK